MFITAVVKGARGEVLVAGLVPAGSITKQSVPQVDAMARKEVGYPLSFDTQPGHEAFDGMIPLRVPIEQEVAALSERIPVGAEDHEVDPIAKVTTSDPRSQIAPSAVTHGKALELLLVEKCGEPCLAIVPGFEAQGAILSPVCS